MLEIEEPALRNTQISFEKMHEAGACCYKIALIEGTDAFALNDSEVRAARGAGLTVLTAPDGTNYVERPNAETDQTETTFRNLGLRKSHELLRIRSSRGS